MGTITIKYLNNLRTEAVHAKSGSKLLTDAPVDNKGKGEQFSPTDLTATSLLSCMLTIMGIAAREHDIPFNEVSGTVEKIMLSKPRRIGELKVVIKIREDGQSDIDKQKLHKAASECPVAFSLHPDINQGLEIAYY